MSFRKFFFSAAAMGVLLLPGITVSASAHSLSDRYTLHQTDSIDDDCTYYDDCTRSGEDSVNDPYYVSQYEDSDGSTDDGSTDDGSTDDESCTDCLYPGADVI